MKAGKKDSVVLMSDDYRSVSIPATLVEEIERMISKSGRYRTSSEFIIEAARLRLEALEKQ